MDGQHVEHGYSRLGNFWGGQLEVIGSVYRRLNVVRSCSVGGQFLFTCSDTVGLIIDLYNLLIINHL